MTTHQSADGWIELERLCGLAVADDLRPVVARYRAHVEALTGEKSLGPRMRASDTRDGIVSVRKHGRALVRAVNRLNRHGRVFLVHHGAPALDELLAALMALDAAASAPLPTLSRLAKEDKAPSRGRPRRDDGARWKDGVLEREIAWTLHKHGVRLTRYRDGVLAKTLDLVDRLVGRPEAGDPMPRLRRLTAKAGEKI